MIQIYLYYIGIMQEFFFYGIIVKDECIIRFIGFVVLFFVEMWLLILIYKKYLVMEWFCFYCNVVRVLGDLDRKVFCL